MIIPDATLSAGREIGKITRWQKHTRKQREEKPLINGGTISMSYTVYALHLLHYLLFCTAEVALLFGPCNLSSSCFMHSRRQVKRK